MMKTSTPKRIGMALVMLFVCAFAFAEDLRLDFKKNPMEWPNGRDKMALNTEYTYKDIVFTVTKFDGRFKTYMDRNYLTINPYNVFKLKAINGKRIKKVAFQIRMDDDYTLETNDKRFAVRENSKYYYHEWDEAKEEIVFTNASRLTEVIVSDMFITLEGEETPVAPEPEVPTTTATYDFRSLNPAWNVESVEYDPFNKTNGKIEDDHTLVQDGVVLTPSNMARNEYIRVLEHILTIPATSGFSLEAPAGKTIAKVEFQFGSTRSYLKAKGTNDEIAVVSKMGTHEVNAQKVSFEAIERKSQIVKINVVLKDATTTGITTVRETKQNDNRVYNLNGVVVGTTEQLNTLPKGVYIVNGTKILVH